MKPSRRLASTVFAVMCPLAAGVTAQQPTSSKLPVPIVNVVGCASYSADGTWLLTRASEPKVSNVAHAAEDELEEAMKTALGANRYGLLGTADFASVDHLLKQGQRAQIVTKESANTSGQLQNGHKVVVKGLLITDAKERRLNLLFVQSLTNTCK